MTKKLFSFYKTPLLLSLVLSIVIIALNSSKPVEYLTQIFIGAFVGTFFLDIEYFLYAYLFEPQADFSKTLLGFVRHRDFFSAVSYLNYHKDEIKEKSINSGVFQVVLALVCISVVLASTFTIIQVLVLSMYANSIYKFAESYFKGTLDDWFWALKKTPSKPTLVAYTIALVSVLIFCLYFLR
jgi:hypothetical protein